MSIHKISVFLLCSGLGHISRGYESFTEECFEALSGEPELDMTLFKGGGPAREKQVTLWNLRRNAPFTQWLGKVTGKGGYWLEQMTFTLSLLPHVMRGRPDVIYFSDCNVGNLLWHWRWLTKQSYKLLLSNGGPLKPPFPRWDFVQQLTPTNAAKAGAAGQSLEKQMVLPYGIRMAPQISIDSSSEKTARRVSLGLPCDRPVLLSVGAINRKHKRMDYVIREVAALLEPRPFLVLLGQMDEETPAVQTLAECLLGEGHFQIATVAYREVEPYYRTDDAFILASLDEGFGRVFLEAMSQGLPCLAHDYEITQFILGEHGGLSDFTQKGTLAYCLQRLLEEDHSQGKRIARHGYIFEKFSWQRLGPHYVQMIQRANALSRVKCL